MLIPRSLAALLVLAMVMQAMVTGTAAQIEGSRWTAPTYGFTVSWAGTGWDADPAGTLAGVGPERLDRLHLINGVSSLYFEGATRYAGDLDACIAEEANILSREPGVSGVRPLLEHNGEPIVPLADGAIAAAFTLSLDAGGQQLELIDFLECRELIPGEAVLVITLVADAAQFESEFASAVSVAESITLAADVQLSPITAYGSLIASALAEPSLAGPESGELAFGPGTLAVSRLGVDTADFYARVEFAHPQPAELPAWDFGIGFRDRGEEEQLRLIVDAEGSWFFKDGLGPVIAQGELPDIATSPAATNVIEIVAAGDRGYFAFNERLVSELDLSSRDGAGDLFAGAGFFTEDAVSDATTSFLDFQVWPLPAANAAMAAVAPEMSALEAAGILDAARAEAPLAGPLTGDLAQRVGEATVLAANVEVSDFVASATFRNPQDAAEHPWDIGIAFRAQESGEHYRVTVSADGSWELQIGTEAPIAGGGVPRLNFAAGAANSIDLIVSDSGGGFAVNGQFVAPLDLSALTGSSDIWAGTGFHLGAVSTDAVVRIEDFTVWPLPAAASPDAMPADASATPAAASAMDLQNVTFRIREVNESGLDALAVLSGRESVTEVVVEARDAAGGETVALHAGTCDEVSEPPLFPLEPLSYSRRSISTIDASLTDLRDGQHAVVVQRAYETVACAEIPG